MSAVQSQITGYENTDLVKQDRLYMVCPQRFELLSLFESFYEELKKYILSILRNTHDTEDVLQDVYISLTTKNISTSHAITEKKKYLFQTARNHALSYHRKASLRRHHSISQHLTEEDLTSESISPEKNYEAEKIASALRRSLRAMPAKRRNVLLLLRFRGLSREAVAQELGITVSAVDKHLHRSLKLCRDSLIEEGLL